MDQITEVAACTTAAAHRRDHEHGGRGDCCRPHAVEVVYLGGSGLCVCHDCRTDSGFLPRREADALAAGHRERTRDADVALSA